MTTTPIAPTVPTPTPTPTPAPSGGRLGGRARLTLLVLCGAIFLEGIDVAMLNVALPSIREDLGLSTGTLSAVVSAYVLGYGGFTLLGGSAADRFGRRRMFIGWLAVFLVFSGLGGLATEGWMLLTARFVTGVAAAFMTPAGLSLITTNFAEGPVRNKALLIYGATGGAGFSLGLVAGGLLTEIDWRLVFFAPVALSAVLLPLAVRVVVDAPTSRGRGRGRFDVPGAVTLTAGAVLVVYAVTRLEHPGERWGVTVAAFAIGVALLVAFVAVERRVPAPLLRLGLLRSARLVRSNVTALLFAAAFFGFQFLASIYMQELLGWSSLETGLALLVMALDVILAPLVTPRLVQRFGTTAVAAAGVASAAAGYALFLRLSLDWTYAAMFPTMLLIGIAFSLAYGPLTISATDGVAEREQGVASGLVNTAFQFGAALGVSLAGAVSVITLGDGTSTGAALDAIRAALFVPVVAAVAGTAVMASGIRSRRVCVDEPEDTPLAA
jgi:MFS family permease